MSTAKTSSAPAKSGKTKSTEGSNLTSVVNIVEVTDEVDLKHVGGTTDAKKRQMVEELETAREFKNYTRGREKVVVKWGMPKCPPCKLIAPTFEKLSETHPGLALAEANVTSRAMGGIVDQYDVNKVPMFHFFHNGKHLPELNYQGVNPDRLLKHANALLNLDKNKQ